MSKEKPEKPEVDPSEKRNEVDIHKVVMGASGYVTEEFQVILRSRKTMEDLEKDALELWKEIKK